MKTSFYYVNPDANKPSISEIESLGYYDFMAYLKVPFFDIGGNSSLDLLVERCPVLLGSLMRLFLISSASVIMRNDPNVLAIIPFETGFRPR